MVKKRCDKLREDKKTTNYELSQWADMVKQLWTFWKKHKILCR